MDTTHVVRPGYQTVAIAAVELAEQLHHLFPEAVVKPSEPYEDEDICLIVYGPWEGEEIDRIRRRIYALEFDVYDKYAVEAMVKALPLSFLPGSAS
ncbi:MAG: hypothetical protein ACREOH_14955 [Candidatus Entotheonellia bacterium]